MSTAEAPLSAPLEISFDYTRSLGGVLGRFVNRLAERRIAGVRGADGRVHVPPVEYDPGTAEALTELVEVSQTGTVVSWSWVAEPVEGQPIQQPFAWALIRLDGADTALLHAVHVRGPEEMSTGMRVLVRWADEPIGHITDIAYFVSADERDALPEPPTPQRPPVAKKKAEKEEGSEISTIVTPVSLSYTHSVSPEESRYLRALGEGMLLGQRCPACGNVYIPPRGACPTDGVPTTTEVELPDTGIVTTFCIVNVPFLGQRITPPYVAASILLDGADIPFLHLVLGCDAEEVRMGMRVRASWQPREQWGTTLENIHHFEPTGDPDAEYSTYARHL